MKRTLLIAAFIIFPSMFAHAQDPEVRREAVQMLERANAVSLSPDLPNLERIDTFRVLDATSGPHEGTFTRVVLQGTGRRDEVKFGEYHMLDIWSDEHLATIRTRELPPAEVDTILRITPIYLVTFNNDDVIQRIVDKAVGGKNAKCIEFETIKGRKVDNNELCVDPSNGALLLEKIEGETIENSDFFSFAGMLIPGKIAYSFNGVRKLEISQSMTEMKDGSESVLTAPPDAQIRKFCTTDRRPIAVSLPQPKQGNGGRDIDVAIRALIGTDGRVHDAVLQSAERADLGAEALSLVQQWVFNPALCNGQPNEVEGTLIAHFHGR